MNKLMGKKITEGSSDATVRLNFFPLDCRILMNVKSFAKQDLPKEHRVLEPGAMTTQDYNPNRYVLCPVISGVGGNDKLII